MIELPLFPLNTVLFPTMPINLHIFEPRYIEMIELCLQEKKPFGIVLIRKGQEAFGPIPETYSIGCTAEITKTQKLTLRRLNILAVGRQRFRIQELDQSKAYLKGQVEILSYPEENAKRLKEASEALKPWITKYMFHLQQANLLQPQSYKIPEDPLEIAHFGAYLLLIPSRQKQPLLEIENPLELIETTQEVYQREVSLVKALLKNEQRGTDPTKWVN